MISDYERIIAVVNTIDRSLELYKWIKKDTSLNKHGKELLKIADKMFSLIADDGVKRHKHRMLAYGEVYGLNEYNETLDPNIIEYVLYEGECQDKEKLSYFLPTRIIEKRTLNSNQIKKLNQYFVKKRS